MADGEILAQIADVMNAEQYKKIKALFNQAVEMSLLERQNFVAAECAENSEMRREIEKMLVFAADTTDELDKNAFEIFATTAQPMVPEKIGGYKIIREIGRGGMGAVYEAARETEDFRQRVALKIIKRGMDSDAILSRFRHERQILATLEHPNIARFLDGGMTEDGLPFYAMEFVEGGFIDDYCRERNLSIEERLKLFREVCSAVQYAHQNLVIHRDLKPKNILVTADGKPKLLDFGIGKILTSESADEIGTATQLGMMTPAYASPEQIQGKRIGTTSDVYSLGIILYELLTGQKPYKISSFSQLEIERAIIETEPPRPSTALNSRFQISNFKFQKPKTEDRKPKTEFQNKNPKSQIPNPKSLRGDLDNIILKALRKEPEKRYASAQEFSEDIRRHLEGLPVLARPDTFAYRASKFIRRNRISVSAAVIVFLSLCAGITVALWQAREARLAEKRAEHRFKEVRELANSVIFKYHDAIANLPGSTAAREMLVKDATLYLDNLAAESDGNPELQRELARAYLKLGDVQGKAYAANLGDTAGATESYLKAVALLESLADSEKSDTRTKLELIKAYESLFAIYMRFDMVKKYEALEKALRLQDKIIAAEPDNEDFQLQKAQLLLRKGDTTADFRGKLENYQKALPLAEKLFASGERTDEKTRFLMRLYQRIGTVYLWLGDEAVQKGENASDFYSSAFPFHEKSFAFAESFYLRDRQNLMNRRFYGVGMKNLAETLAKNGVRDEALAKSELALQIFNQTIEEDPRNSEAKSDAAEAYFAQSRIWQVLGERQNAVKSLEKSLELNRQVWQADGKNLEIRSMIEKQQKELAKLSGQTDKTEKIAFYRRK